MANPQKENGSTDIANELLEIIYSNKFNGTELSIILCILRYTYGFHRKEHSLSITFIAKAINRHKLEVSKYINKLIKENILIEYEKPSFSATRQIGINKDYSKWNNIQLVKLLTPSKNTNTTVSKITNRGVSKITNQETKNKTKKETKNIYTQFEEEFEVLWKKYPNKKDRARALKSYIKTREKGIDYNIINKGLDNYVNYVKQNNIQTQYIKHGQTWFNNECWNDEYEIKRGGDYEELN